MICVRQSRLIFRPSLGSVSHFPTPTLYGNMFRNKYKQSIDCDTIKYSSVIDLWSTAPPTVIKAFIHIKAEHTIFGSRVSWVLLASFTVNHDAPLAKFSFTRTVYNAMIYSAACHYADIRRNLIQVCGPIQPFHHRRSVYVIASTWWVRERERVSTVKFPWHGELRGG